MEKQSRGELGLRQLQFHVGWWGSASVSRWQWSGWGHRARHEDTWGKTASDRRRKPYGVRGETSSSLSEEWQGARYHQVEWWGKNSRKGELGAQHRALKTFVSIWASSSRLHKPAFWWNFFLQDRYFAKGGFIVSSTKSLFFKKSLLIFSLREFWKALYHHTCF